MLSSLSRAVPPSTRYQGSKLKLLPWLAKQFDALDFSTVLDAFGGTASVSFLLKQTGHAVTFNDYLVANWHIGRALIENPGVTLSAEDRTFVLERDPRYSYASFIADTFRDIYFTDAENAWLDVVVQNIARLTNPYKQSLAYYALFQACIAKRPYNLFHRKNLYMRTAAVSRTFGNKVTWDTPFATHFLAFLDSGERAVFRGDADCVACCRDARDVAGEFDCVYIDTPYINSRGVGVDYFNFYHFLDGCASYESWGARLDRRRRHLPLVGERSPWSDPRRTHAAFQELFERHRRSLLVVSYRSDGIPSLDELIRVIQRLKRKVRVETSGGYQYVLSTNRKSQEVLIIGE